MCYKFFFNRSGNKIGNALGDKIDEGVKKNYIYWEENE